ncbi:MAG: PHP domain-containing protein [Oscillospiraceae bacterium]|nr:PHP domain-containing protein [Oscillospiraceae bacterium]
MNSMNDTENIYGYGRLDMHIHTTASDGTDSPREVVELAHSLGVEAIAITDHDSVAGVAEAQAAGAELGVEVVAGIEISADYLGNRAHVLGYFIDPDSPALAPAVNWAVNERDARNVKIVGAMQADGFDISLDALREAYPDAVLGRPHMAEWLMKKGYVSSIKEAFDRYLGEGKPYYRNRERMPMTQAMEVILQAGGLPVLAHPFQYGYNDRERFDFVKAAVEAGCQGLEAYYSEHDQPQRRWVLERAAQFGLKVSGGSDYHGTRKPHIQLGSGIDGSLKLPFAVLEQLRSPDWRIDSCLMP